MTEGPNTPPMGEPPDANQGAQSGGAPPPSGGAPPPPSGGAPPPTGQPAPGSVSQPGIGEPTDLMTRFLAKLIDWVILGIAMGIVWAIMFGILFSAAASGRGFGAGGGFVFGLVYAVIATAIVVGYFAFLESNRGQTVGKMLMKIQVQNAQGANPTMEEAVKRNGYLALYLLWIIPFVGWLLASLGILAATIYIAVTINNNTQTRQGWHDEFAGGTRVIKIG